jgi:hypothetical protein
MLADPVDDGRACSARVVHVRKTVRKARPEVQQSPRAFPSCASTVGRARTHFEQPEHDTQPGHGPRSRRSAPGGAWVREAHTDTCANGGFDETECPCSHPALPCDTGIGSAPLNAELSARPDHVKDTSNVNRHVFAVDAATGTPATATD